MTKEEVEDIGFLLSECHRLEARIKELEKDLKMYFDSCRLREDSLFEEVERREKAEAKIKELTEGIEKQWRDRQGTSLAPLERIRVDEELYKLVEKK
jgi:hypothetical protein